jgi:hypothetical protein
VINLNFASQLNHPFDQTKSLAEISLKQNKQKPNLLSLAHTNLQKLWHTKFAMLMTVYYDCNMTPHWNINDPRNLWQITVVDGVENTAETFLGKVNNSDVRAYNFTFEMAR